MTIFKEKDSDRDFMMDQSIRCFTFYTGPIKGFYTFGESAHSPIFEEPLKVREIMLHDVLKGSADLADKN